MPSEDQSAGIHRITVGAWQEALSSDLWTERFVLVGLVSMLTGVMPGLFALVVLGWIGYVVQPPAALGFLIAWTVFLAIYSSHYPDVDKLEGWDVE